MKRAWYIKNKDNSTYKNIPFGTILNITNTNYIWDTFLYNNDWIGFIDFDDSLFNLDLIKVKEENGVIEVSNIDNIEEINQLELESNEIQKELVKMEYGKEVLAYIGVNLNTLEVEQYQSLLSDNNLFTIQTLLKQGALESCYSLIHNFTPNEIITQLLLDKVKMKIQYYINQLQ